MIISVSRRTDIPAFYAAWFMERLREGFCLVPNPYNPAQQSTVSLRPEEVDVLVFWTRNPRPLFPFLKEMDERGYRYYFLMTVMDNPKAIDRHGPSLAEALSAFQTLSERIGPEKVIWRYDPILFSTVTPCSFHLEKYAAIAGGMKGFTRRSIISLADLYKKVRRRFKALEKEGIRLLDPEEQEVGELLSGIARIAGEQGMTVQSCAQENSLEAFGIRPGKCIDHEWIARVFGKTVDPKKDPSQRKACGCVTSRDIGMYDSCLYECLYCYASNNFAAARERHGKNYPGSPSLIPLTEGGRSGEKGKGGIRP
jgi:hypothetical protein